MRFLPVVLLLFGVMGFDSAAQTLKPPAIAAKPVEFHQEQAIVPNRDSFLRVEVRDPNPRPVDQVYVTLWKAVDLHDELRIILQPNDLGLYDRVFWRDRINNSIWIRHRSKISSISEHAEFQALEAGKYRVTVVRYDAKSPRPDPTPYGVSKPVSFHSGGAETARVSLSGDMPLTVRVVDVDSKSPLKGANIRLRSSSGMPIVHGHGSGNFFERTDSKGEVHYSKLQPGTYFVEVLGKSSTVSNLIEYRPLPHDIRIQIPSSDTTKDIPLVGRQLTKEEVENRYPFSIIGSATTEDGKPLEGVENRAYSGFATLFRTGSTTTNAAGAYKLRFMPGGAVLGHKWGAGGQVVKIRTRKDGFHVKDLGDAVLSVSDRPIDGRSNVVLPNKPYQLDFVLIPAD